MNDLVYRSERSITFYVAAKREQHAATSERTLTAWAALALALVLLGLIIGGCS